MSGFPKVPTQAITPSSIAATGNIDTTGVYQVNGTQVVAARGAAVADVPAGGVGAAAGAWSTAANRDAAIASINALFARLRAHGLISP